MVILPNRVPEPKLFSSWGREPASSRPIEQFSATRTETETARPSRHVLPQDLNTAIQHLDDQELDRLVLVALAERSRRKRPPLPEESQRSRRAEADAAPLPQGKQNAVRAAFKAGVSPARIAREFGLSQSDVRKALADHANKR
jgi:DNA-directed RNA polymerase specialized sigma24 family protein